KPNLGSTNGVYHIISESLKPKENIWEFIQKSNLNQNQFVRGLNEFDLFNRKADSEDDLNLNNEFLESLADVRQENKRFTYFVYSNTAFDEFTNEFSEYVNYSNEADTTLELSKFYTVEDLVFEGSCSNDNLPVV